MTIKVNFKRLHPDAILPTRATNGSVGYDLYALEDHLVPARVVELIGTGWAMELPYGWVGKIVPRSRMSENFIVANSPGTVDPDYRGEIKVMLVKRHSFGPAEIKAGTRIAQLLFQLVELPELVEVDELSETVRGEGSFGSTGE